MTDSLLDDVTSLLNGDFGDDRILKQIARACKNNEVISNYERNYVQKLAEQYLGKKPEITNITISDDSSSDDQVVMIQYLKLKLQFHLKYLNHNLLVVQILI